MTPTHEIHVHGDVLLRLDVTEKQARDVLAPLWRYAGAKSFSDGAQSLFEDEPGLQFDAREHAVRMCWTVEGDANFGRVAEELCLSLNDVAREGAPIEVGYYPIVDDDEDGPPPSEGDEPQFQLLFVGPTPQAIMQAQRDLLVDDVIHAMERHFDASALSGVVGEIDKLFAERMASMTQSLNIVDYGKRPPHEPRGGKRHLH